MFTKSINFESIEVRLANCIKEIEGIQKLRYKIFFEEMGANPGSLEVFDQKRDFDCLDNVCDHLIAIDHDTGLIVGGYRLVNEKAASLNGGFLTANEFDISKIRSYSKGSNLELSRACVAKEYRKKRVMDLLWQGIESYIRYYDIQLLFGTASFRGIDPTPFMQGLSFLHYFYLAPEIYRPLAFAKSAININFLPQDEINIRTALKQLPPLIKGYLRLGGFIGENAFIDKSFNSLDVCIVLETKNLPDRYTKHYLNTPNQKI